MKFLMKMKILAVQGSEAQRAFAGFEPRVDPSMGRKINEISSDIKGIRGSVGLADSAKPQNLSLVQTPVWEGKSLKFLRKIKDSGGPGSDSGKS